MSRPRRILQAGDHIAARSIWPGIIHHGIYDGAAVIHSTPGRGVHRSALSTFGDGRPFLILRPLDPSLCLERARSRLGAAWTLGDNCETFAYFASTGRPLSPQLRRARRLIGGPLRGFGAG